MAKLFNNIRKKIISEKPSASRTANYLKYAIGEIILVVIGILIALSINNWNEKRKEKIEEQALLAQLKSEFKSNLQQLDEKITFRNSMIASSFKILDYIDKPIKRNKDSLLKYIVPTLLVPTFDPIVNDIMSSGRIELLQNRKLKELLSRWTSEIIQVTEEEVSWRNYKENNLYFMTDIIPFRTLLNEYWQNNTMKYFYLDKGTKVNFNLKNSTKPINIDAVFDNLNFENYIANCASFSKIANVQSMSLRKRIVEILTLIEDETY